MELGAEERGRRKGLAEAAELLDAVLSKAQTEEFLLYIRWDDVAKTALAIKEAAGVPSKYALCWKPDAEKALEALNEAAPPKDCPFCGDEDGMPCSSCMERARVAGELSFTKDLLECLLVEVR